MQSFCKPEGIREEILGVGAQIDLQRLGTLDSRVTGPLKQENGVLDCFKDSCFCIQHESERERQRDKMRRFYRIFFLFYFAEKTMISILSMIKNGKFERGILELNPLWLCPQKGLLVRLNLQMLFYSIKNII